ncbi:hypothetical protein [Bradyrhizobium sp. 33ap4]|uniref:hypothetical protein n=1 Tax=Bradyrhizobium sp. 33ap4 TaxID=3061630 RepID=UPI003977B77A
MRKVHTLAFVVAWFLAAQPCFADDREKVVGIWKLMSQEIEIQATGGERTRHGEFPNGIGQGVIVVVLSLLLFAPRRGQTPEASTSKFVQLGRIQYKPLQVLREPTF